MALAGLYFIFLSWALAGLCLANNFLAVSVCALGGIYLAVVGSRALAWLWLGSGLALMGSGWAPAGLWLGSAWVLAWLYSGLWLGLVLTCWLALVVIWLGPG